MKIRKLFNILVMALCVVTLSSCHTHKRGSRPAVEVAPAEGHLNLRDAGEMQKRIIAEALTYVGTPYAYAGESKKEGVDCSGMVMKVYEDVTGCKLPRNSAKQAEFCRRLNPKEVAVGDLVFFATGKDPDKVSHVGIVIDDRSFIHSSSAKGVVVSKIYAPYYQRTFKMFGRVPGVSDDMDIASHTHEK